MKQINETTNVKELVIPATNALLIADVHLGVRSSNEEWQHNIKTYFYEWFIPFVKQYKTKYPDTVILGLGDIYDDRKSINIDVNELSLDIFEELGNILPVYIINGNHDLSKKTNKGNSSLRSLEYVPGITIIKEPTILKIKPDKKIISKIIAIPYLGSHENENNYLLEYSKKTDYALMHTDITKMKFDNGMQIVGAVDATLFKGHIFSGHIHKRQDSENVTYVGSPYQLRRSDIGNTKGIYDINFIEKTYNFTENTYSPIFHKINVDDLLNMSIVERNAFLDNNYNDIIIEEENLRKYKMTDIYDIANLSNAKHVQIVINKSKENENVEEEKEYSEKTIEDLINESIEQLDLENDDIERLKNISSEYMRHVINEEVQE